MRTARPCSTSPSSAPASPVRRWPGAAGRRRAAVLLLEAEIQPGLHSTGRSAAMFMESYGPPQVRALTRASRSLLRASTGRLCDVPLVSPRGVLYVAWQGQQAALEPCRPSCGQRRAGRAHRRRAALRACPVLRRDGLLGALHEPDALDIDVQRAAPGLLARRAAPRCRPVDRARAAAGAREGDGWRCNWPTAARRTRPPARRTPPAPGPTSGRALRRGAAGHPAQAPQRLHLRRAGGVDFRRWPTVCGVTKTGTSSPTPASCWARRPTPTRCRPHDVQPEELDIATGIARHRARHHAAHPPPAPHLGRPAQLRARR
jgi:D-arginine dehydrogenase